MKEFILGFCINLGTYREPVLDICYIDLKIGYFFSLTHSAYFILVVVLRYLLSEVSCPKGRN
jgi:hypothetical protein